MLDNYKAMHINITKTETGNNKGSSSLLIAYLEKENRLAENAGEQYQVEYWFNQDRDTIQPYEARQGIDNNVAKLSKNDAKFFLVNISPSQKEIKFLKEQYGNGGAREYLKAYANLVMDAYAKNFKRIGVDGNNNLVYYGKLEQHRYYTYKDLEVKKGKAKKGDVKPGEHLHVQVIVSRKDASNRIKLSPLNNSKGTNQKHSQLVGQFDRVAFKQTTEALFDEMFGYKREVRESFDYANTLKHGTYEQKQDLKVLAAQAIRHSSMGQEVSGSKGLLEVLFHIESADYVNPDSNLRKRRKRRRGHGYRY